MQRMEEGSPTMWNHHSPTLASLSVRALPSPYICDRPENKMQQHKYLSNEILTART